MDYAPENIVTGAKVYYLRYPLRCLFEKEDDYYTKISHGKKEIGNPLIKQMSEQCKIDKKDFMDLVNCPIDKNGYLKILKEKNILSDENEKD